MIEDVRDIMYVRTSIPPDALRLTTRILLQCDAADGGMIVTAHNGYERPGNVWSCNLLFAKNLLAPEGWTTPKLELHALSSLANMCSVIESSLGEWVELILSFSDSEIALAWTMYEKSKLHVFQRLRVSNIWNKLDLDKLSIVSS